LSSIGVDNPIGSFVTNWHCEFTVKQKTARMTSYSKASSQHFEGKNRWSGDHFLGSRIWAKTSILFQEKLSRRREGWPWEWRLGGSVSWFLFSSTVIGLFVQQTGSVCGIAEGFFSSASKLVPPFRSARPFKM